MQTAYDTPLKRAIRESILSQRELAKKVGVTEATMSRYARGLLPPTPRQTLIACALGLEVSDLWPATEAVA